MDYFLPFSGSDSSSARFYSRPQFSASNPLFERTVTKFESGFFVSLVTVFWMGFSEELAIELFERVVKELVAELFEGDLEATDHQQLNQRKSCLICHTGLASRTALLDKFAIKLMNELFEWDDKNQSIRYQEFS